MNRSEDCSKTSILIPTYNWVHCLTEAIETSLQQDYSNFVVIVSDNAFRHTPQLTLWQIMRNLNSVLSKLGIKKCCWLI